MTNVTPATLAVVCRTTAPSLKSGNSSLPFVLVKLLGVLSVVGDILGMIEDSTG